MTTLLMLLIAASSMQAGFEVDTLQTEKGDLKIIFIGHGTLYFEWNDIVVHVDPWSRLADYSQLPKADLVLVTHEHGDHLSPDAIKAVSSESTQVILTEKCISKVSGTVMKNGDVREILGISVAAVPAYNIKHRRDNGQPFHPKGDGNGYVITFGGKKVYVAGDTENIPEMAALRGQIDIAFLPMNVPYTMTPEMAAEAARMIAPAILYPYHFSDTNVQQLVDLLKGENIEIRIRKMH